MSDFWAYQSCPSCSGAAQPGTVALLKYLLNRFPGTRSLGIYDCRDQRGGSDLSIHACGRAGDDGIPLRNGEADTALGDPIVRLLIEFAHELGIMGIIWNRVRYDAKSPRGRVYTGLVPHKDHIHFEQVPSVAATLTYSDIERICGDEMALKVGDSGNAVAKFQGGLNTWTELTNPSRPGFPIGVDGVFGPQTETAVKAYQRAAGLDETGQIDGVTASLIAEYIPDRAGSQGPPGPQGPSGPQGPPGPQPTSATFTYE